MNTCQPALSVALHNDFPVQLKNTNNARPTLPYEFIMGEILTLAIHERFTES